WQFSVQIAGSRHLDDAGRVVPSALFQFAFEEHPMETVPLIFAPFPVSRGEGDAEVPEEFGREAGADFTPGLVGFQLVEKIRIDSAAILLDDDRVASGKINPKFIAVAC